MEEQNIPPASITTVIQTMATELQRTDTDLPIGMNTLIINDKNELLLSKRGKNAFMGGTWGLVGGHLQNTETFEEGIARECWEELNIKVNTSDVSIRNLGDCMGERRYLQIGAIVKKWEGEMKIMEPHKCEEIRFFPLDALPENLFFGTKVNIDLFLKGTFYDKECNYCER